MTCRSDSGRLRFNLLPADSMLKTCFLAIAFSSLLVALAPAATAAPAYNKCIIGGTTTYQREACPSGEARKDPTVEQLNAERKKQQQQRLQADKGNSVVAAPERVSEQAQAGSVDKPPAAPAQPYRCDGRTRCTQMTSCAEAKYFLSHCPGVKMDGDGDGVPCEEQWCNW
jgi:hypothetical protein